MIKIVTTIREFDLHIEESILDNLECKKYIKFKISRSSEYKQLISFYTSEGKGIEMDLMGRTSDTIIRGLFWKHFNNKDLVLLTDLFDLKIQKIESRGEDPNLSAVISNNNFQSFAPKLGIKKYGDNYFLMIFHLEYPDKTFDGEVYVHGIWEVELGN